MRKVSLCTFGIVCISTFLLLGNVGPLLEPICNRKVSSIFCPKFPLVTEILAGVASAVLAFASPKSMAVIPSCLSKQVQRVESSSRTSVCQISTKLPSIWFPNFKDSRILGKDTSLGTTCVPQSAVLTACPGQKPQLEKKKKKLKPHSGARCSSKAEAAGGVAAAKARGSAARSSP